MSLEVGIQNGKETNYRLSLEDDGYYWFLHPLFEKMANSIGIYIDLYGHAQFKKDNIVYLESLLKEAYLMILDKPDYWDVHTGTQTAPIEKEIYSKVSKSQFIEKLDVLSSMVSEVKNSDSKMVFSGD